MRLLAIGVCAAILLGACSRYSGSFQRFTHTPPPPTPTSNVPTGSVRLKLQTLKGRSVTTGIDLPPEVSVGPKDAILEAKALWRVPAAPTPDPPAFASPQLTITHESLFVSTGTDIERIGMRSGRVLWRSSSAALPFTVSAKLVAAAHANTVIALSERDGRVLWRRAVCPVTTRVAAVAVDGQAIFGLCADPAKLIALRAQSGQVLYTRILSESDRGTSLQLLGSGTLLADGFFNGAWMGDNFYFVREHTGDVVLKRTNIELLRVRGSVADFVDRCCFGRTDTYEPANILSVNLLNGDTGKEAVLAPERHRFQEDGGGGAYGPDGTVFAGKSYLYLFYGDTLFRYANLDAAPIELMRGIERLIYAHADGFVAVLEGDPDSMLFRIDWTAKPPVLRPIAAIESASPNQIAISPTPITTDTLDDIRLTVSSHGTVERLPSNCSNAGAAAASEQIIAAICTPGSGVGFIEAFSARPWRFFAERTPIHPVASSKEK